MGIHSPIPLHRVHLVSLVSLVCSARHPVRNVWRHCTPCRRSQYWLRFRHDVCWRCPTLQPALCTQCFHLTEKSTYRHMCLLQVSSIAPAQHKRLFIVVVPHAHKLCRLVQRPATLKQDLNPGPAIPRPPALRHCKYPNSFSLPIRDLGLRGVPMQIL